jgi:hypothetical protein
MRPTVPPVPQVPPVPPDRTAVRPGWTELPAGVRDAVQRRLGSPVVVSHLAGGGFTRGFAAVLGLADGGRVFVKAAPTLTAPHLADWYVREHAVVDALPPGLPVPRPRWLLETDGYLVACADAVDGRIPALPWRAAELDEVLRAYADLAAALVEPGAGLLALGLPRFADLARHDLAWWREVAEGREPAPAGGPDHRGRLAELVALESLLPSYAHTGAVMHGDLRVDNVLLDHAGRAWFCDWNWACHGPAWFDLVTLLLPGYAGGLDVDTRFATHPVARDAAPDALDVALAALSGYYLTAAGAGPTDASPHVRGHQRWSGTVALAWLARRRGWS